MLFLPDTVHHSCRALALAGSFLAILTVNTMVKAADNPLLQPDPGFSRSAPPTSALRDEMDRGRRDEVRQQLKTMTERAHDKTTLSKDAESEKLTDLLQRSERQRLESSLQPALPTSPASVPNDGQLTDTLLGTPLPGQIPPAPRINHGKKHLKKAGATIAEQATLPASPPSSP